MQTWSSCEWKAKSDLIHKLLRLEHLAVYWQKVAPDIALHACSCLHAPISTMYYPHNFSCFQGLDRFDAKNVSASSGAPSDVFFLLSPLTAEARLSVNRGRPTAENPRLKIDGSYLDSASIISFLRLCLHATMQKGDSYLFFMHAI
jgi:hypothetical protein